MLLISLPNWTYRTTQTACLSTLLACLIHATTENVLSCLWFEFASCVTGTSLFHNSLENDGWIFQRVSLFMLDRCPAPRFIWYSVQPGQTLSSKISVQTLTRCHLSGLYPKNNQRCLFVKASPECQAVLLLRIETHRKVYKVIHSSSI